MIGNRKSAQERQIEQQKTHDQHQSNLGQPDQSVFKQNGQLKDGIIDELADSSLDEGTAVMLQNLLSRDFIFGNMAAAEINEVRWLARNLKLKVEAMHPTRESDLAGEYRKAVADDPRQALKPLDDAQRAEMFSFIMGVIARASRSKEGWQQEQLTKSVRVSETREASDGDSGGWF